MLVLTRQSRQSVTFPHLDIEVEVLKVGASNVRIGIKAPPEIAVMRKEILSRVGPLGLPEGKVADRLAFLANHVQRTREWLTSVGSSDTDEALEKVVADLQLLSAQQKPEPRPKLKAMIVDDNDNETRLLASFLRLRRFDVEVAHDGERAIEQLEASELPDCVLLDMNMPRYDGRWTIQRIRESSRFAPLKVFGISGLAPDECGVTVGPAGLDRWFQKPLDPLSLVSAIERETMRLNQNVSA